MTRVAYFLQESDMFHIPDDKDYPSIEEVKAVLKTLRTEQLWDIADQLRVKADYGPNRDEVMEAIELEFEEFYDAQGLY